MTELVSNFTGDQAALNAVWEKVTARKPLGGGNRGFARVAVSR